MFYNHVTKQNFKRQNIENKIYLTNKKQNKKQNQSKNKTEEKVMKTKNNVQKAILKSLAIVASLVLISITVSAQDFWKTLLENSSFNEIALAMSNNNNEASSESAETSTDLSLFAAILAEETEESLEMEDWMINENHFAIFFTIEEETEEALELEDWMINEDNFTASFSLLEETDEPFELEDWMLNTSTFEVKGVETVKNKVISSNTYVFQEATESELKMEKWMFSEKYWKI